MNKLEQRYQEQLKLRDKGVISLEDMKPTKQNPDNNYFRQMNFNDPKNDIKVTDDYVTVQKKILNSREQEMEEELNKLKLDKAKKRMILQGEEDALMELMREVELKRERELRARIEKEQIKKALVDLEKTKLTTLEQEKRSQLQKLSNDRDVLKLREEELLNEISKMERDANALDQIRKDDMQKVSDAAEQIKNRRVDNNKVNDMLLQERSDRIANLRLRREQLENERMRIMEDLEKVKNGEINGLRKNHSGILAAKGMLNDMKNLQNYNATTMHDKLRMNDEEFKVILTK